MARFAPARSAALTAAALVLGTPAAMAATASLQVIHNAGDPAAAEVDVYVNGDLALDDFAYRTATPFLDLPAGVELSVAVAPGDSDSVDDALATFPITLSPWRSYVAVASGVLDPSGFAENPDGRDLAFTILPTRARTRAVLPFFTDVLVHHGATDAPQVDVVARGLWTRELADDLGYGEFGGYDILLPRAYDVDVTLADDRSAVVASYAADLSGLRGEAVIVFASGFLDPTMPEGVAPFGLFAALGDGTVIELPRRDATARLQVVHNAADPAAAEVDVYVNGDLTLDDFAFRDATPFLDVPAGVDLLIEVAPGTSSSADDALAGFTVNLDDRGTYVAMATGVLDPDGFSGNPDGLPIGFTLVPTAGREHARLPWLVDILAFHGSPDAPAVDVVARRGWWDRRVVRDLAYGSFDDGYRFLGGRSYTLDVTPAGSDAVVASYAADLSGLRGGAAVVFASGFLSPDDDQDGAPFGLLVALPDGTVLELPAAAAREEEDRTVIAQVPVLGQNAPNPFNPRTRIQVSLPEASNVSLVVYNVNGQEVARLVDGSMEAGLHDITFDAARLPSGMYYYQLRTGGTSLVRRMTLLK